MNRVLLNYNICLKSIQKKLTRRVSSFIHILYEYSLNIIINQICIKIFFLPFFHTDQNTDTLTMMNMAEENFCMDMVDLNCINGRHTHLWKEFTKPVMY